MLTDLLVRINNIFSVKQEFIAIMTSFPDEAFYNITETYNPRYRKGQFKHLLLNRNKSSPAQPEKQARIELGQTIMHNFRALHGYINNLDELFKARMSVHEEEIIQIAHSEIKKIQLESESIIKMYSELIRAKNINAEILDLKYEVKYYQKRACEMFEENKELKRQIKILKGQIDVFKLQEETHHMALRNVSKKYLKEKTIRKNIELGGLKKMLLSEPSEGNIKISLLSRSAIDLNPEKDEPQSNQKQSPTRQDSIISKQKDGRSSKKQRFAQKSSMNNEDLRQRVRTEPARDYLPFIKLK